MSAETIFFASLVFWISLLLVVFLPIRWALVAYFILIQIDLSGPANYSLGSLGYENAIKVIAVPTLLLLRSRPLISMSPALRRLRSSWLALVAYAGFASLWSPYHLPAVKMMGYFYAYSVLFLVFMAAWERKWLETKHLITAVWFCLALACIQTYVLGNDYGDSGFDFRLTSFTGAQSFAPFLLGFLVLMWFSREINLSVVISAAAAGVGLVLTGSRSLLLGFAWSLFIGAIYLGVRAGRKVNLRLIVKRMVVTGLALAAIGTIVFIEQPDSRINQMLEGAFSRGGSLEDVGTFAWRFSLYQKTVAELSSRSPIKLALGTGTSSGANLVLDEGIATEDNVDPNRTFNEEFLRFLYEWGIPGLALLVYLLFQVGAVCLQMVQRNSREGWAFLAIFIPLLISLTVENIFADASSPGGMGYLLVLTFMLAAFNQYREKNRENIIDTQQI
jgi:O-antigen ligase